MTKAVYFPSNMGWIASLQILLQKKIAAVKKNEYHRCQIPLNLAYQNGASLAS